MEKGIELKIIKKNWKSMWRGNSNITEAIIYLFFFYLLSSTGPRPIDVVSLRYRRKETKEKEKNNDVLKNVCLLSIYPRAPLSLSVQSLLGVTPRWSCGLLLANIQLRNLSLSLSPSPLCSSLNPLALLSLFLLFVLLQEKLFDIMSCETSRSKELLNQL